MPAKFLFSGGYLDQHKNGFGDDECVLLLLSPTSFFLLADMSRMLLWPTRYEEGVVPKLGRDAYQQMNNPSCINIEMDLDALTEPLTALVDAIIAKEMDMINNQTVTVTCGCGCQEMQASSASDGSELPDGYDVEQVPVEEPDFIVEGGEKCDRATYQMVQYRNACLGVAETVLGGGGFDAYNSWIGRIWDWVASVSGDFNDYLILQGWVGMGDFSTFDDFLNNFDPNFNAMVCALYQAETAQAGKDAAFEILDNFVLEHVDTFMGLVFKRMWQIVPFGWVFDASIDANLPPGYEGRECCGSVPYEEPDGTELLPDVPVGYSFVPTFYNGFSAPDASTAVEGSGNQVTVTWSNPVENPWGVDVQVNYNVATPQLVGKEHVGMLWLLEGLDMTTDRVVEIKGGSGWGSELSGSNPMGAVNLMGDIGEAYTSILYAFGNIHDDLHPVCLSIGDVFDTGTMRDGSYTKYQNKFGGQNDNVAGTITLRTWHIVRDAV